MTVPELTLNKVKKEKVRNFRASDFLTQEQIEEVKESNLRGKKTTSFNEVDSYIAEIIARFGYDTYVAWKFGEIDEKSMMKYIEAELMRKYNTFNKLARDLQANREPFPFAITIGEA